MQQATRFTLAFFCCVLAACAYAQKPFSNCTAAFLDDKMVVDTYTPTGKCTVAVTATGVLAVCTADLSPTASIPVDKVKFKIALRDHNTGTLTMYSDETFKRVLIQKVLAKCHPGDHILLITLDDQYALPHNEILVQ